MTDSSNFYFTIHSFMTRELGLRGSALIIYAIIYSFSADGKGTFYGSRETLAEFAGVSVWTVSVALKELVKGGLVCVANGKLREHKEYKVNTDKISNQRAQNSHAENVKITRKECENHMREPQNSHAKNVKPPHDNKHNNKQYIEPIINIYNGADAREKEKERIFCNEDLKGEKNEAPSADRAAAAGYTENKPIYEGKSTYTPASFNSLSKNQGSPYRDLRQKKSKSVPKRDLGFDPEEAFRIALERTEAWAAEILAEKQAAAKESENSAPSADTDTSLKAAESSLCVCGTDSSPNVYAESYGANPSTDISLKSSSANPSTENLP